MIYSAAFRNRLSVKKIQTKKKMTLILLITLNFLFWLEFFLTFFSLLLTKPFFYIFGHVKSVILNCFQNSTFLFFFQIGFLLLSFSSYTFFYSLMFPEIEKGELPNPPQVIAQLCSWFFQFKYQEGRVRERHMLLLSLFLSFLSSFFFRGGSPQLLVVFSLGYVLVIYLFPLDSSELSLFLILSFYSCEQSLSKWGFFLVVQLFFFFLITLLFAKGQPCPKNRFVHFLCAGAFFLFHGFFSYNENSFSQPSKLSILFSGACIIYLCLKKRTKLELWFCFVVYFFLSLHASFLLSPTHAKKLWGIPYGIFICITLNFLALLGFLLFHDNLPRRKQALLSLFYSVLFYIYAYFPGLAWLERWIEGIDLLLCILCLFSLLEEEEETDRDHPPHK